MTISTTGPHFPTRRRLVQTQSSPSQPIQRSVPSDAAATKPVLNVQHQHQATATSPSQRVVSPGTPLEWSGFSSTMEAAVSKELLTDWRYDC